MRFRAVTTPGPSKGISFKDIPKVVKPNEALSLQEILERFTRGEALDIGKEPRYHDSELDLEKLRGLDPIEREEIIEGLSAVQATYRRQEEEKKKAAVAAEVKRLAAEELARKAKENAAVAEQSA